MPFHYRRRGSSMRPVNRIKHVIDKQAGVVLNVQNATVLAVGNDSPVQANTTEVESGSTINGIYLKVEASATTAAALANCYLMVVKNPGATITFPNANVVGAFVNKKYVIHQEMVMLQKDATGNPRTVFNGVIVIPRGYRRMSLLDQLVAFVFAPGVNIDLCVQCHYKEFR